MMKRGAIRALAIISACAAAVFIAYFMVKSAVEKSNSEYETQAELSTSYRDEDEEKAQNTDNKNMIYHSVQGEAPKKLPGQYGEKSAIYENSLYVTKDKGETYLKVPDDTYDDYAHISDYIDSISNSSIYVSDDRISVIYGGKLSQNVSVMTWEKGYDNLWGVSTIDRTASHDSLGYLSMNIDYDKESGIGYAVLQKSSDNSVKAYKNINGGSVWDSVDSTDKDYKEILSRFGIREE